MTLIIGAGLAGLACALELQRRGVEYLLLEAEPEPGGRVRSRVTPDGFTLDRGFQVALDSYPALGRQLDLAALQPRYLDSGAILREGARSWTLAHPLRHPADLPASAFGDAFPLADRVRLAALTAQLLLTPDETLLAGTRSRRDVSTAQFLFARGFSGGVVERFLRPFFAGIFLEERLATSAALFRYYFKKFAVGRAFVPARGMGEIPRRLAAQLPPARLRLGCRVERLEPRAVITAGGERLAAERVVLATAAPATARLLGHPPTPPGLGVTTLYYRSARPLYDRALLVLPAGRGRRVRHFVQLTNAAPEYAPPGQHLLSASILGSAPEDDATLAQIALAEIAEFYPAARGLLTLVSVVRVPYAQYPQPPGFARRPAPVLPANVLLAGDQTTACSIETALTSGERAAGAWCEQMDFPSAAKATNVPL